MRIHLTKLALLGLLAPLAACGSETRDETESDADTGADVSEDIRVRPDVTEEVIEEDAGPDVTPDVAPDVTPDVGPDTSGPARCGNGVRDVSTGEICDGEDMLPGVSCISQNFVGGDISCASNCTLDTSGCYAELCGDGVISGSETCDGSITGGATCESLGFAPGGEGTVVCDECQYDTSTCEDSICGNNNLEDGFEECDGTAFGDDSCRARGFFGGDLVCSEACDAIDAEGCVPNICGNGTVEGDEVCDSRLFEVTCRDLEVPEDRLPVDTGEGSGEGSGEPVEPGPLFFAGGLLACSDSCFEYDTSTCIVTAEELGADTDDDGIGDDDDNCPNDANPRQLDVDNNGVGNVCDDDIVYDVLVGTPEENVVVVNAAVGGGLFGGGGGAIPLEIQVEGGEVLVAFDDDGVATTTDFSLVFGESVTPIDLGGGGLPIPLPIPLPTAVDLTILGGGVLLDATASPAGFSTAGDFATYLSGAIEGANSVFGIEFDLSADAGDAGAANIVGSRANIAASSSSINLYDGSYALTFAEGTAPIGTLDLNLNLLPGFPLPIEVALSGLAGTVSFELAAP